MSTCARLLAAVAALSSPACAAMSHRTARVTVGTPTETLTHEMDEERVVGPRSLYASDVRLDGSRLSLVLGSTESCATVTVRTYDVTETVESAWVGSSGLRAPMAAYAAGEIVVGLIAPAIAVGCAATRACGSDEPTDQLAPPAGADTVEHALVLGSIVGGVMVLSGLVDAAASASAGETSQRTSERVDRITGASYPCREGPLAHAKGTLTLGKRRLDLETDGEGRARVDLEQLHADAIDVGALPLRVAVEGIAEARLLDQLPPDIVSRVLTSASDTDLRRQIVAALPIEFMGRGARTSTQASALLEVYSAHLSAAGLRLVPSSAVAQALERESSASFRPCVDDGCQIEIGRQLAANVVLRTTVVRIGDDCTVSAVPFDLRTATTLEGATRQGACRAAHVRDALAAIAADLAR